MGICAEQTLVLACQATRYGLGVLRPFRRREREQCIGRIRESAARQRRLDLLLSTPSLLFLLVGTGHSVAPVAVAVIEVDEEVQQRFLGRFSLV